MGEAPWGRGDLSCSHLLGGTSWAKHGTEASCLGLLVSEGGLGSGLRSGFSLLPLAVSWVRLRVPCFQYVVVLIGGHSGAS